ncbi:MAG: NYN domain-containing protein [Treponema sp.]|jgi:uncharacterized LabA/DUF88 family protein|nr:NYN domain-containing protein [Treponema sp.]
MAVRKKELIRIGVYYDGHYFYKVSNYYKFDHPRQARISITGLHGFVTNEVSTRLETESDKCKLAELHYFRGRSIKNGNEKAIVGERYFEDALTKEGVNLHYLPLVRGVNNELKEKGIDVSLALDAYKKAIAKAFDVMVLIAGDGDYLPLVRELQAMTTPINVMLLSWDYECTNGDVTMTSQDLLEEVKYPLQMARVIDDRLNLKNPFITGLFEPRQYEAAPPQTDPQAPAHTPPFGAFPSAPPFTGGAFPQPSPYASPLGGPVGAPGASPQGFSPSQPPHGAKRRALTEAEMAQERISTILSLNGSGGWIRDVEYNNFYFFYTDVMNKKPEELAPGMTLQFRLKFDRIKTEQKDNGEPSYRAIGPIYAVD